MEDKVFGRRDAGFGKQVCMKCRVIYTRIEDRNYCPTCGRHDPSDPLLTETDITLAELEGNLRFWKLIYRRRL
jgi:hypothetical protein